MPRYVVYINYINRNGSNVSTSSHLDASSESEAKRIAISKINGRVTSATVKKRRKLINKMGRNENGVLG